MKNARLVSAQLQWQRLAGVALQASGACSRIFSPVKTPQQCLAVWALQGRKLAQDQRDPLRIHDFFADGSILVRTTGLGQPS